MTEPINSIVVRLNDYECRCSQEYDNAYCNIYRVFDYGYELVESFDINVRIHNFELRSVIAEIGAHLQKLIENSAS